MLEETEKGINQAGTLVMGRINEINSQLEEVTVADTHLPRGEPIQTPPGPSRSESLDVFEETWKEAQSEIASRRIRIGKVVQGIDGRALVGVHGLNGEEARMDLDVDDVNMGDKSKAAIGVTRGLDLNAFFK